MGKGKYLNPKNWRGVGLALTIFENRLEILDKLHKSEIDVDKLKKLYSELVNLSAEVEVYWEKYRTEEYKQRYLDLKKACNGLSVEIGDKIKHKRQA